MKPDTRRAAVNQLAAATIKGLPKAFLDIADPDDLTSATRKASEKLFDALTASFDLPVLQLPSSEKELMTWHAEVTIATMLFYDRLLRFGISDETADQIILEVARVTRHK